MEWGSIIAGLISLVSSVITNLQSKSSAKEAQQFSENMSDTAVQRRKEDLIKAGFNPLLAVGQAASSPTGVTYPIEDAGNNALTAFNNTRRTSSEVRQAQANVNLTNANAENAKENLNLIKEQEKSQMVEQAKNWAQGKEANAKASYINSQIPKQQYETIIEANKATMSNQRQQAFDKMPQLLKDLNNYMDIWTQGFDQLKSTAKSAVSTGADIKYLLK